MRYSRPAVRFDQCAICATLELLLICLLKRVRHRAHLNFHNPPWCRKENFFFFLDRSCSAQLLTGWGQSQLREKSKTKTVYVVPPYSANFNRVHSISWVVVLIPGKPESGAERDCDHRRYDRITKCAAITEPRNDLSFPRTPIQLALARI